MFVLTPFAQEEARKLKKNAVQQVMANWVQLLESVVRIPTNHRRMSDLIWTTLRLIRLIRPVAEELQRASHPSAPQHRHHMAGDGKGNATVSC